VLCIIISGRDVGGIMERTKVDKKYVEHEETIEIRCDRCNKCVVKNHQCVDSFWERLRLDMGYPSEENSSYHLCKECFNKWFLKGLKYLK
jgi:hypothetical protein